MNLIRFISNEAKTLAEVGSSILEMGMPDPAELTPQDITTAIIRFVEIMNKVKVNEANGKVNMQQDFYRWVLERILLTYPKWLVPTAPGTKDQVRSPLKS